MTLSGTDALALLLPTESFLVGAIAVAVSVRGPDRVVPRFNLPAAGMPVATIIVTACIVTGAVAAWCQIFVGEDWRPLSEVLVAVSLLAAVLGQGFLAVWLALGMFDG